MRRAYLRCLSRPLFFVIWAAQTKQTSHSCNRCLLTLCKPFRLQMACPHLHEATCMQVQARGTPPASQPLGGRQSSLWSVSPLHDAPALSCRPLGHALAFAAAKHASSGHTDLPSSLPLQHVLCTSCLPAYLRPTACRIMFRTSAAILLALGFASAQFPLEQGIVPNDQYTAAPAAPPLGTDGWRTGRSTFFDGSDTFKNAYIARYINCLVDIGLHICGRTHACNDKVCNVRA